jgi:uncharacterized protein YcbK (DUF882 family)
VEKDGIIMGDLTKDFSLKEFACKCCGKVEVDKKLVTLLQDMRDIVGPLVIESGYRCEKHNAEVGGGKNSAHLRGKAADIRCYTPRLRYDLLCVVPTRFTRFGVGENLIHVDVDDSLDQDVAWTYYK